MAELNRKFLINFNFCLIIYVLTCVPLVINLPLNTLYSQFANDLSTENCELPLQIKLPFNASNVQNSYLDICNKADATSALKEAQLMCKEIFDILKYVFCLPKNITLPEINVKISEQVCTDINTLTVSEKEKDKYFINHLKEKITCDILCDGPVAKACQILLWSYEVQQQIRIHESLIKDLTSTIDPKVIDSSKQSSLTAEENNKPENVDENETGIHVKEQAINSNSKTTTKEIEHTSKDQHNSEENIGSQNIVEKVTGSQSITEKNSEVNGLPLETSAINTNPDNNPNQLEEQKVKDNLDQSQNQEDPHDNHPDDAVDENVEEKEDQIVNENNLPPISTADEDAPHESPLHDEDKINLNPNEVEGNTVNSKVDENQSKVTDGKVEKVTHEIKTTQQTLVSICPPQGDCSNVKIADDLSIPLGKVGNVQATPEEKTTDGQTITDLKSKTVEQANTVADVKATNMDENRISPVSDGVKDEIILNKGGEEYGDTENDEDVGEYLKPEYGNGYEPAKNVPDIANFPDSTIKIKEPSTIQTKDEEEFSFNQERKKIAMMAAFPEQESGNFFFYFLSIVMIVMAGYLVFHNKQKIIALIVEGRHERRRRSNGAGYKKLETK